MATESEHEARRWNLSPEALYLDCWTRAFLREHLDPSAVSAACNIGIGLGQFDDWLGYWLPPPAQLTSVDIDGDAVRRFAERQQRDAHPKPAVVLHGDLMQLEPGPFDLVTIVGSTIHETHAPALALQTAQRWVKPGGWFYATILHGFAAPDHLVTNVGGVVQRRAYVELPDAAFTAVLARRSAG